MRRIYNVQQQKGFRKHIHSLVWFSSFFFFLPFLLKQLIVCSHYISYPNYPRYINA